MDIKSEPRAPLRVTFVSFLLSRIGAQAAVQGVELRDREAILERIRRVLECQRLDPSEESLVANQGEGLDVGAAKDAWIALRVQRALAAGLDLAAERSAPNLTLLPIRVVVRRSRTPTMRALVMASPATSEATQESEADPELAFCPDVAGLLVLADAQEFERLSRHRQRVTHGVLPPLDARTKSNKAAPESGAIELSPGIEVCGLAFALRDMKATISAIFRGDSPGLHSVTAVVSPSELDAEDNRADLSPGLLFHGKYRIVRLIGRGGFGTVYEACDIRVGSRVAIKLLNESLAHDSTELEQFLEEARRLSRLEHANIVGWKVFDEDEHGRRYLVMELLEGEELSSVLAREKRMAPRRAAQILLQIADALRAAHLLPGGESILHLDLKPKNVFLLPPRVGLDTERVKVIDFGVGQFIGGILVEPLTSEPSSSNGSASLEEAPPADGLGSSGDSIRVPRASASTGDSRRLAACTPEYASPEHCSHLLPDLQAEPLDGRADIYSLGVLGFLMLTGELPFKAPANRFEYLRLHRTVQSRRISDLGVKVPRELARFIARCLEKQPSARWPSAQEAYEALYRIVHPSPLRLVARYVLPTFLVGAAIIWAAWPERLGHPFDIYADIDGVEQLVEKHGLWLGPKRSTASLRLFGADRGNTPERLSLQASTAVDAPALEGWNLDWQDNVHVTIKRDGAAPDFAGTAYLRIQADGQPVRLSSPFDLRWISGGAWEIADARISGLAMRKLDPVGQTFEILVRGTRDAIAGIFIEIGSQRLPVPIESPTEAGDIATYRVSLDGLRWTQGPNQVRVNVVDRAGMARVRECTFDVVLAPLEVLQATLSGVRIGGRYALSNVNIPELHVELSRPARMKWTIFDSGDRKLAVGDGEAASQHTLALPSFATFESGTTFSGTVVFWADEAETVGHANQKRGAVDQRLQFVFDEEMPQIALYLAPRDRADRIELHAGDERFISLSNAELTVVRLNTIPIAIELEFGRPGEPIRIERRQLSDPALPSTAFDLEFPVDGAYRLTVHAYRMGVDSGIAGEPEFTSTAQLSVDRTSAQIIAEAANSIVDSGSAEPLMARMSVQDDESSGVSAPVAVDWDLARVDGQRRSLRNGQLDTPLGQGEHRQVVLPLPWLDGASSTLSDTDGHYVVRYSGTDVAGNSAVAATVAFEIALRGPALNVRAPTAHLSWSPGESGAFEVELLSQDPNGTASVSAQLLPVAGEGPGKSCELARAPASADDATLWRGHINLDSSWSETDVILKLVANDGRGARSEQLFERHIGLIERRRPDVVRSQVIGECVARMALVRGNRDAQYDFGGRADADEDKLFRESGLERWRTQALQRSWQVHYPPGAIKDFYLDQREVSVREMLTFVRNRVMWNEPAFWPQSAPPSEHRRCALEASLVRVQSDMPAIGLTWPEANAFARAAGKRLPSLVEWEYAVRGGLLYRPYSCAGSGGRPIVAATASSTIEEGNDITPQNGLRNLCGNVAEWTSTPAWLPDGREIPRNAAFHAERWSAQLLDPQIQEGWNVAGSYWVAGGSWRSSRFHFFVIDRREREASSDAVGFRCAASIDDIMRGLEDPRAPVRFEIEQ